MISFTERDVTFEYSVVGAMLIEPKCIDDVLAVVGADDFSNELCKAAVRAVVELRNEAQPIDALLIYNRAKQIDGNFTYEFAKECMKLCPTAVNAAEHAKIVKAASDTEKLTGIADGINEDVFNRKSPNSIVSSLRQNLEIISIGTASGIANSESLASLWKAHDEKAKVDPESVYCKTGYSSFDIVLGGGLFKTGLYIIAARPGMGKTTFGLGLAENIASRDKPVLFVSLEMTGEQVQAKRIARKCGLGYTELMTGVYKGQELHRAMETNARLSKLPFFLYDGSRCKVSDIENMSHGIKNLSCIVVDYFGLIAAEDSNNNKSRYEETTIISASLKGLAKRLKIPIILLCQLNRNNTQKNDKRPTLADLRDTGALEQDADCVILLHREEYYKQHDEEYEPPEIEFIELNVAKNRHGKTQVCKMIWDGATGGIAEESLRTDEPFYMASGDLPF